MENTEYSWDHYIKAQAEQKAILDTLCKPYSPAELCEIITEQEEINDVQNRT